MHTDRELSSKNSDIVITEDHANQCCKMYRYHPTETPRHKVIEKLSKYKDLETETTRMWGMRTETVPVIVVALGLIREGMDQKLGKIPAARNGTHTEKVSVHQIKTPLVPQDQGLVPVLGECRKQLTALKTFIMIIIIIIIIIII